MALFADRILYKKNWQVPRDNSGRDPQGDRERVALVRGILGGIAAKLYTTRIYTVNDQALRMLHDVSRSINSDIALRNIDLFRLPHERIWVELDRQAMFPHTDAPGNTAYLLERRGDTGFTVMILEEWHGDNVVGPQMHPWMIAFEFNSEPTKLQKSHFPFEPGEKMQFCMGWTDRMVEAYYPGTSAALAKHMEITVSPDYNRAIGYKIGDRTVDEATRQAMLQELPEIAGTLRHIMGFLLLLHFPPVARSGGRKSGTRLVNGKNRPYLHVDTLTLHIPKRKTSWDLSHVLKAARGAAKRRHEVSGHWRKYRKLTDVELNEICVSRGITRAELGPQEFYKWSWVREHERGDAGIGHTVRHRHLKAK